MTGYRQVRSIKATIEHVVPTLVCAVHRSYKQKIQFQTGIRAKVLCCKYARQVHEANAQRIYRKRGIENTHTHLAQGSPPTQHWRPAGLQNSSNSSQTSSPHLTRYFSTPRTQHNNIPNKAGFVDILGTIIIHDATCIPPLVQSLTKQGRPNGFMGTCLAK